MRLGWKTISGAILWGVGILTSPEVFAALPGPLASVVSVVGVVLGALGVRHAIAKGPSK